MPDRVIAITGLGVVSAIGIGRDAFTRALASDKSGLRSLGDRTDEGARPNPDGADDPFWWGAPIVDFDPKLYVTPRKALKVMCREIQTAFAATQLAIADADLQQSLPAGEPAQPPGPDAAAPADAATSGRVIPCDRVSTVFGSEMFYGPPDEMESAFRHCLRADGSVDPSQFGQGVMKGVMPLWMLKYLPNMPACQVGIATGAHGPNNTLVVGDVSGPAALIEASGYLRRGLADVILWGATGTRINTTRLNYRLDYPGVTRRSLPSGVASLPPARVTVGPKPWGVFGGEGSVVGVLEPIDHASRRGAKPLAMVAAAVSRFVPSRAMASGRRTGDPALASGRGSAAAIGAAIDAAIAQAGLRDADIGLVVSHAMGDASMDAAEADVLAGRFAGADVVYPMSQLGHTGAASGGFAIATAVACMNDGGGTLPAVAADRGVLCLCHTSEGSATAVILTRHRP